MNDIKLFKHSFNYLNLNYSFRQGQFVYHNVLTRCGDSMADPSTVSGLPEKIELLTGWYQELWDNVPAMADAGKERILREMLENCRQSLPEYLDLIRSRLEDKEPEMKDMPFMMAVLARQAYTRESFVNATVAYAEYAGLDELADRWRQHIPSVNSGIAEVSGRLSRFLDKDDLEGLFGELSEECDGTSDIIEAQLDDIDEVTTGYEADLKRG